MSLSIWFAVMGQSMLLLYLSAFVAVHWIWPGGMLQAFQSSSCVSGVRRSHCCVCVCMLYLILSPFLLLFYGRYLGDRDAQEKRKPILGEGRHSPPASDLQQWAGQPDRAECAQHPGEAGQLPGPGMYEIGLHTTLVTLEICISLRWMIIESGPGYVGCINKLCPCFQHQHVSYIKCVWR